MTRALFGPLRRIHWSAVGAMCVTAIGALCSPAVLAVLPARYATAVIVVGAVLQACTKTVTRPAQDGAA